MTGDIGVENLRSITYNDENIQVVVTGRLIGGNVGSMRIFSAECGVGSIVQKAAAAKCQEICRQHLVQKMYAIVSEAEAERMTSQEVTSVVSASLDIDTSPYAPVPASLLRLARTT